MNSVLVTSFWRSFFNSILAQFCLFKVSVLSVYYHPTYFQSIFDICGIWAFFSKCTVNWFELARIFRLATKSHCGKIMQEQGRKTSCLFCRRYCWKSEMSIVPIGTTYNRSRNFLRRVKGMVGGANQWQKKDYWFQNHWSYRTIK